MCKLTTDHQSLIEHARKFYNAYTFIDSLRENMKIPEGSDLEKELCNLHTQALNVN